MRRILFLLLALAWLAFPTVAIYAEGGLGSPTAIDQTTIQQNLVACLTKQSKVYCKGNCTLSTCNPASQIVPSGEEGYSCLEFHNTTCQAIQGAGPAGFPKDLQAQELKKKIDETITAPKLQIDIPGLQPFTKQDIKIVEEDGKFFAIIPFIAKYLEGIFRYVLAIGGIVATVLIMAAGFDWILAAGSAEAISKAKAKITNAVFGLVLIFGSYLLLSTINPDLVKLNPLKIFVVQRETFEGLIEHAELVAEEISTTPIPAGTKVSTPAAHTPALSNSFKVDNSFLGSLDACCLAGAGKQPKKRNLSEVNLVVIHEGVSTAKQLVNLWQKNATEGVSKDCSKPAIRKKYAKECAGHENETIRVYFGASSHYFIDDKGIIYQLTGENIVSRHAGSANSASIGIDLNAHCKQNAGRNPATCSYTDETYAALKALIQDISARTSIQLNDAQIKGHCEGEGAWGGHADPGNFDWLRIGLKNDAHAACARPVSSS